MDISLNTHTRVSVCVLYIYVNIYIYVCVCVCVCLHMTFLLYNKWGKELKYTTELSALMKKEIMNIYLDKMNTFVIVGIYIIYIYTIIKRAWGHLAIFKKNTH